jgi:hypothetical protein
MSGPKRSILMLSVVLVEFDMRIENGEKEEDDLQLIDGLRLTPAVFSICICKLTICKLTI